ncbi:DUF1003 domain-containing protein [Brooklawnia sp.]|uniref:DUF1003 domain-containing protein n=1 Tax=Brooklawnia sp. TaxID=2699740 RepID=UPI00311F3EAF
MAEANRRDEDRLSTPGRRSSIIRPRWLRFDEDWFGRFAEWIARTMGSPGFLMGMTVLVFLWILLNVVGIFGWKWDPYPFILLNLAFSTQASYSAPLILLAQNRQEDRDRLSLDEDRRVAGQSRADMDFLAREIAALRTNMGELSTRDFVRGELRDQLRDLLAEIEAADERPDGEISPTQSEPA